eukprot:354318-Chlamydomonas_euryale.AAC.13
MPTAMPQECHAQPVLRWSARSPATAPGKCFHIQVQGRWPACSTPFTSAQSIHKSNWYQYVRKMYCAVHQY